jgi:predicted glycoside hydrolase/deacetylase ChbG (UPF0249 family)
MTRRIWIVADDYGLSPAVDDGILELLDQGRLSGTGCMTIFPDWLEEARRLRSRHVDKAGLHLTLTEQPSLSGSATLSRQGRLPALAPLLKGIATRQIADADLHAELDAQWERFVEAFERPPLYLDGHQHVHFLPPVRHWLKALARRAGLPLPWLRGAPAAAYSPKIAVVKALSSRFDRGMAKAGYAVKGPLAGFYDWRTGDEFAPTVQHAVRTLTDDAVLMVHPGHVDQILRNRDILTDTRSVELRYLASDTFVRVLESADAEVAAP